MREIYSDVNIIGGGLIGAVCAYSISKLDFKISILEKNPVFNSKNNYSDKRTVAISEGTKQFLDTLGLWREIRNFSEPIKKIKIIDRADSNFLEFDNVRRKSNLGYIVKNRDLLNVIYKNLQKSKNITMLNNVKINKIDCSSEQILINAKNFTINSQLNIAADGKNSFVKRLLKTPFFKKKYNKKAIVINFAHTKNHNNTAYEFFFNEGPLAILPMQKNTKNFLSSIVWTNDCNYVDNLFRMDEKKIISILNQKTNLCLGKITKLFSKQQFPLSAHLNSKFYENRTIYIGDCAHSFHPIAGQGWNLGMKDVAKLYKLSKEYKNLGMCIGDKIFCKKYHDQTFYEAYTLYQLTDKIDNLFKQKNYLSNFLRSKGIRFIQTNSKIKNIISDFAMGF